MTTNLDLIAAHYEASARGDLEGMLAPLADDIRWTEAAGFPLAGTYVGPQAVLQNVFAALAKDWDDFGVDLERLLDAGERIVAVANYRGKNKKTGKTLLTRVVHLWEVADGKAVSFEQIVDSVPVLEAMS
ncbi:nuclear transport factor 2 family protein [Psychromicrobium lacuslunae]|uniref:Ketosteroid isomerase n=1 Tax=Psychromicrobium lacuslunae TaxID=1618207 RepID=A0A0D4BXW8_9MICC|nr:nuclear transport factor 2 family protein [Psychromicrobium lacuslunae]AJT41302.1 ketosteroid isomerase [Psychromicrobium lacuslunae]